MEAAELKQLATEALTASLEADREKPAHKRLGEDYIRREKLIEVEAGEMVALAEGLPDRVAKALYVGSASLEAERTVLVKAADVAHVAGLRLQATPAAKPAEKPRVANKPQADAEK